MNKLALSAKLFLLLILALLLAACSRTPSDIPTALTTLAGGTFSDLDASLNLNAAEFSFSYTGDTPATFRIDLSTTADMSWDVYGAFGAGDSSPIVVTNPEWDKYVCGATLYWRVIDTTNNVMSDDIQTATVCPENFFSDLNAALNETLANFDFSYSGSGTSFTVTTSTRPDMIGGTVGSVSGTSSPIKLEKPGATWADYRCGVVLYWRVTDESGHSSPIQEKHVCSHVGFSKLKASLTGEQATFEFRYRGVTDHFRVELSTVADMSTDVYVFFGTGQSSPIVVADPQSWDKYRCGETLYWRVHEQLNGRSSDIQTAVVTCS